MILDLKNRVMTSYAPTTVATHFQDYLDRLVAMENAGGAALWAWIQVAAAVTSGGAGTVQFQVIGNASDPTFASGNVVLADSGVLAKTVLIAGHLIPLSLRRVDHDSLETSTQFLRYLTVLATIGTAALTAGTFNAWFAPEPMQDNLSYRAGYAASL